VATRSIRETARETVRWRGGSARLGAWRGNPEIGHVVLGATAPPTPDAVDDCLDRLRALGFEAAVTSAMSPRDATAFVDAGFEVRERLHLLEHLGEPVPDVDPSLPPTRRARRSDRAEVIALDARAFPPFWHLEAVGLHDAVHATPAARFRIAAAPARGGDRTRSRIVAYAITGRAGRKGYLQRVAVDPDAQRIGYGRALVEDALRWLHHHDVRRTLVNTQLDNLRAVALYESCGFRRLPAGLCVLGRAL
jgi:ribosomal protein S18 acetylase RimI-like enzyme